MSGQHVVEQVALPVLLAAERQRDQPRRLQLVERREQLVPVGRRLGARAGQCGGRIEQPVLAMDVYRHRVGVAVARHRLDEGGRQDGVPVLRCLLGVHIREQIVLDQIVELLAGIELHRRWRIAAHGAIDRRGARIGAAGNGGVHPGAARRAVLFGEDLHRRRLATGGPPVDHLRWGAVGLRLACKGQQGDERNCGGRAMEHGDPPSRRFSGAHCNSMAHIGLRNFSTNSSTGVGLRNTMAVRVSSGWRRKAASETNSNPAASTSVRNVFSAIR